jgi:hypothetical protein
MCPTGQRDQSPRLPLNAQDMDEPHGNAFGQHFVVRIETLELVM